MFLLTSWDFSKQPKLLPAPPPDHLIHSLWQLLPGIWQWKGGGIPRILACLTHGNTHSKFSVLWLQQDEGSSCGLDRTAQYKPEHSSLSPGSRLTLVPKLCGDSLNSSFKLCFRADWGEGQTGGKAGGDCLEETTQQLLVLNICLLYLQGDKLNTD